MTLHIIMLIVELSIEFTELAGYALQKLLHFECFIQTHNQHIPLQTFHYFLNVDIHNLKCYLLVYLEIIFMSIHE